MKLLRGLSINLKRLPISIENSLGVQSEIATFLSSSVECSKVPRVPKDFENIVYVVPRFRKFELVLVRKGNSKSLETPKLLNVLNIL